MELKNANFWVVAVPILVPVVESRTIFLASVIVKWPVHATFPVATTEVAVRAVHEIVVQDKAPDAVTVVHDKAPDAVTVVQDKAPEAVTVVQAKAPDAVTVVQARVVQVNPALRVWPVCWMLA